MSISINEDIRHIVEAELQQGEKLLWADIPTKFPFYKSTFLAMIFSLWVLIICVGIIGGGTLLASTAEYKSNGSVLSFAVAIVVSLIAIIFLCAILMHNPVKLFFAPSKEIYALTDQRGLVVCSFLGPRFGVLNTVDFSTMVRVGDRAIGTLWFGETNAFGKYNIIDWHFMYGTVCVNAFRNIKNPSEVEALIRNTFLERKSTMNKPPSTPFIPAQAGSQ